MRPVLSKRQFVEEYVKGTFGNRAPTWSTPRELDKSYYDGLVHLRNRTAGGPTFYNITVEEALIAWEAMVQQDNWYCSGMAPHKHNLFQGEVWDGPGGLYLHGSFDKNVPMREALVHARDWTGLMAKQILDWAFNDLSRQWLDYLLEEYEDHVIEFSAFGICWGTVPGHNVVIWETRRY